MDKIKQFQNRIEMIGNMMDIADIYNNQYFSVDWIKKMLNLEKNDIRKYKINRIFNDEAGKI